MSNTEQMVSVPRADVEIMAEPASHKERISIRRHEAMFRTRGLLSQPAAQHQGEPVAWVYMRDGEVCYDPDVVISSHCGDVVGDGDSWAMVYTRPDTGEVERLRAEVRALRKTLPNSTTELVDLRAKLAERDARLRIYESFPGYLIDRCEGETIYEESLQHWLSDHIKTISTSAEPSVPLVAVEAVTFISERAEPSASKCCTPTAEDEALLASGDYRPEELWGGSRPTFPKCINSEPSAPIERDEFRDLLLSMTYSYRIAIQAGYDQITALGGDCDSVEKMLADLPDYAKARAALERKP